MLLLLSYFPITINLLHLCIPCRNFIHTMKMKMQKKRKKISLFVSYANLIQTVFITFKFHLIKLHFFVSFQFRFKQKFSLDLLCVYVCSVQQRCFFYSYVHRGKWTARSQICILTSLCRNEGTNKMADYQTMNKKKKNDVLHLNQYYRRIISENCPPKNAFQKIGLKLYLK